MAAITVRNLSDATHRALKARAKKHGRSTEAEVRAILDAAIEEPSAIRMGTFMRDLFRDDPVELDIERDKSDPEPIDFS